MKVLVLASAAALAMVLAFSPVSARLGIAPMASPQDDVVNQVRGGGHAHGHHGGRGHHYGLYRGHGNWRHRH
jgi:hypothetical protein